MAEPAIYILTRDGQTESFKDPWGGVFLFRELVWGPDAFERWARQLTPVESSEEHFDAGAIVNFDQKSLHWHADYDVFRSARRQQAYDRILTHAWSGFEITALCETAWQTTTGNPIDEAERSAAAMRVEDAILDPSDLDTAGLNSPSALAETPLAWISIQGTTDSTHHFLLWQITDDLLCGDSDAIRELASQADCPLPAERLLGEGLTIDIKSRSITAWGGRSLQDRVKQLSQATTGWTLTWDESGYAEHCRLVHEKGELMQDAETVASFLPYLLCPKRFDVDSYLEAMSSRTLRRLQRIAGVMAVVLGIPLLGLGLANGNWVPAIILGLCLGLAWHLAQRQARNWIRRQQDEASHVDASAVSAGPTQLAERRSMLGVSLEKAGLVWNSEVEKKMAESPWMKLMKPEDDSTSS